jgi:hypothetical protein
MPVTRHLSWQRKIECQLRCCHHPLVIGVVPSETVQRELGFVRFPTSHTHALEACSERTTAVREIRPVHNLRHYFERSANESITRRVHGKLLEFACDLAPVEQSPSHRLQVIDSSANTRHISLPVPIPEAEIPPDPALYKMRKEFCHEIGDVARTILNGNCCAATLPE